MDKSTRFVRVVKATESDNVLKGEVYPCDFDTEEMRWRIFHGESWTWFDAHELDAFEPASEADFEQTVQRAMRDVDASEAEQREFLQELAGFQANLLTAGDAGAGENTNTTLATSNPAGVLRNKAHSLKKRAAALTQMIKVRRDYLQSKIDQKLAQAAARLKDMTAVVSRLQEVVQTVNLYLGRDEEVRCLREGKPAPVGTPITVRQNVLFMDEEVALEHSHGIDFEEVEKFDKWLLSSPRNLAQVIPELKGVVVLRVRRNAKDYRAESLAEVIEAAQKNELNATSYWLIRNGDRLHRIYANIAVGERLLPRANEVEHFFFDRSYNFGKKSYEETPIRPGSSQFMEAMERADQVRRHYMRLMMVLQGLLDRTQLFVPYPNETRPNLLNPDAYEGQVKFVRDAENVLFDGRPEFREWLREVNANLRAGQRIVGDFPTYFRKEEYNRITPRGAGGVNDGSVYTVTESNGELRFAFERKDEVFVRSTWREAGGFRKPKTKGSYRIYRSDPFFVSIDNASIEDMEFYLKDRRARSEYEAMVPSLKKAIKFKQSEEKAEKPFQELLLRKLNETSAKHECTPETVQNLVIWYKTKNKLNRALVEDDKLAYEQIMGRYRRMTAIDPANATANRVVIKDVIARMGDVLFSCDTGENRYLILRAIDGQPTFARQETWKVKSGTGVLVEVLDYMLPQKASYRGFEVLYTSPEWANRLPAPDVRKFLSPQHYPALLEYVRANPFWDKSRFRPKRNESLLAVYVRQVLQGTEVIVTSVAMTGRQCSDHARVFTKPRVLDHIPLPDPTECHVRWTTGDAPVFSYRVDSGTSTYWSRRDDFQMGWVATEHWVAGHVLYLDEGFLARIREEISRRERHNDRCDDLSRWIRDCGEQSVEFLREKWKEKQLGIYMQQGGDVEFFEDHLRTLPAPEHDADEVAEAIRNKLEKLDRVADVAGKTLKLLRVPADSDTLKELVAAGWVVPAPKPNTEAPSDDDSGDQS